VAALPSADADRRVLEAKQRCTLHTTYLSERLWIVRDGDREDQMAVWERTEVRSVIDRRGVFVEGQLRENPDEEVSDAVNDAVTDSVVSGGGVLR
jgi:hypothetical protein